MYMGKDKYENEDLIKYGWPEDVWFHVDNLSSAHVYVRLPVGKTMDDIPDEVVRECAQLVKENSIEGCKKASVTVIYTPWANLRKDGSMAVSTRSRHLAHGDDHRMRSIILCVAVDSFARAAMVTLLHFKGCPALSVQVGQVSFHSDRNVKKYVVLERDKETLRRLTKTMEERCGDLICRLR